VGPGRDGKLTVAPGGRAWSSRSATRARSCCCSTHRHWRGGTKRWSAGRIHDLRRLSAARDDHYQAPDGLDLSKVEPYRGELVFGPEIVVDSPAEADKAIKRLAARGTVYDRGWTTLEKTGYIDRKVYLQHPNGGISEVQLVPRAIQQLKAGKGHALYEIIRQPSLPLDDREKAAEESRALYTKAIAGTPFTKVGTGL
jgi:hypothetical protein